MYKKYSLDSRKWYPLKMGFHMTELICMPPISSVGGYFKSITSRMSAANFKQSSAAFRWPHQLVGFLFSVHMRIKKSAIWTEHCNCKCRVHV